jgi:hypothetical protein
MNPVFPVIEIVDRLSIAEVKFQRTGTNAEELAWYQDQARHLNIQEIANELESLKQIHNKIWELESELKTGCESELGLEEIGRRAIAVRDHNNKRIALKNAMAEKLGCKVKEIKQDHLSE